MGGVNSEYDQTGGQSAEALAQTAGQKMSANPTSFYQMGSWDIKDPHPEQVAQGIQKSAGMLLDFATGGMAKSSQNATESGSTTKAQRKAAPKARQLADDEMVDEYGYPYTLDGNGQPVYDIGSNQVG